jgi:hypothetical protein
MNKKTIIRKYLHIPKCMICEEPMKNSIDSKTGEVSIYLWETTCEHNKNMKLSIG